MKQMVFIFAVLFSVNSHAQPLPSPLASPSADYDLFLQSRMDEKTFSWLIDKTRIILNNNEIDDRFAGEADFPDDPTFTMDELSQDPNYIHLSEMIASTFKVDLKKAVLRLRISKLKYKVDTIHATPLELSVNDPHLDLRALAEVSGIYLELPEGISIDFMIPNPTTGVLESYFTAAIDPASLNIPSSLPALPIEVKFRALRDQDFKLSLLSSNLDQVPTYVKANEKSLVIQSSKKNMPIGADDMHINPIVVKLNQMTRTIEFDPFKPLIQKKMPQIMTQILIRLSDVVKTTLGPRLLETIFSSSVSSGFSVSNKGLYAHYSTTQFNQPDPLQLLLGVTGDLCTSETYTQYHEQCVLHEPKVEPVRTISDEDHQSALTEVKDAISSGDADVALSVSEAYLNRLLRTTIDAKLWDDSLTQQHLSIGPKGAFVVFNEKTQSPQLYMDILYVGDSGLQSVIINNRHPLRFPLRISTALSFTNVDGIPHLVLKTEKILSDQNEIMNGLPEYGLPSHLLRGFRRKIAAMVLKMAPQIEGQTALDMQIPVFKNIGLEKTHYEVSKSGRLNLYFKL